MSKVRLVTATPNIEEHIAYCARVSNPENQHNNDTAPKLLAYLARHKHWSPFEMGNVVMEIETTRDIARQILRHRSFSFQEFSQRYAEAPGFDDCTAPRLQDKSNRQSSIETDDKYLNQWWRMAQLKVADEAEFLYNEALKKGVAKEVARRLLPEGLTMSRMYVNGSVRSWLHYCEVRCDMSTQKEHREVAEQCKAILKDLMPSLEI